MVRDCTSALAALEAELTEERSVSLFRSGRAVEHALARCTSLLERLAGAPHDAELLAEYREARQAFLQVQWAYCVQREAVGLYEHSWVHRTCPTPPAR